MPSPGIASHQRRRRGTRTVRSASVWMPRWCSTGDDASRQPCVDQITHLRSRKRKCRQDIQRPGHGLAMTGPFTSCALEQWDEIGAMTAERKTSELPTNAANQAARRLAISNGMRAIAFDRFARANAYVPRAQRGQGRRVGKGDRVSKIRHPKIIVIAMTAA
jgi:hypothetical protein